MSFNPNNAGGFRKDAAAKSLLKQRSIANKSRPPEASSLQSNAGDSSLKNAYDDRFPKGFVDKLKKKNNANTTIEELVALYSYAKRNAIGPVGSSGILSKFYTLLGGENGGHLSTSDALLDSIVAQLGTTSTTKKNGAFRVKNAINVNGELTREQAIALANKALKDPKIKPENKVVLYQLLAALLSQQIEARKDQTSKKEEIENLTKLHELLKNFDADGAQISHKNTEEKSVHEGKKMPFDQKSKPDRSADKETSIKAAESGNERTGATNEIANASSISDRQGYHVDPEILRKIEALLKEKLPDHEGNILQDLLIYLNDPNNPVVAAFLSNLKKKL